VAILWTPDLSLGVDEIDRQHQQLFAAVDKLIVAMTEGRGRGEVRQLVGFLDAYRVEHFRTEEGRMAEVGYPGLERHRRLHQIFTDDVGNLVAQLEHSGPSSSLAIEVNTRVAQWLRSHVMAEDKVFGDFLRQTQVANR
jgi:hemerythrin